MKTPQAMKGRVLTSVVCNCGRVCPIANGGGVFCADPPAVRTGHTPPLEPEVRLRCSACGSRIAVYNPAPGGAPYAERTPRGSSRPSEIRPIVRWSRR